MDLSFHWTHWDVEEHVEAAALDVAGRFGTSWNTYNDHPPGYGLDSTSIDLWDPAGRGVPLNEHVGDECVAWLLGQHVIQPIRWLIWFGWIWYPTSGWQPYDAWQGSHHDHVHITFE